MIDKDPTHISLNGLRARLLSPPVPSPLRRRTALLKGLAYPPHPAPGQKRMLSAAVALICLQEHETAPVEVLLIQRASRRGDPWSGHMGLPGGRVEPRDPSTLHTAIRETFEETGLSLSEDQLLGRLPAHFAWGSLRRQPLWVYPFLFGLKQRPSLDLNHEVARTFWIPWQTLFSPSNRGWMLYPWRRLRLPFPCIRYQDARIWGLTLRILDQLLQQIDT